MWQARIDEQEQPFLDYSTARAGMLTLAAEEHERAVRRRLDRVGAQPTDPIHE